MFFFRISFLFKMKFLWFLLLTNAILWCSGLEQEEQETPVQKTLEDLQKLLPDDLKEEEPAVMVALLVRNKAHVLPLVLSYLEQQDYPKKRISLW